MRSLPEWLDYIGRQHAQPVALGLERVREVYGRLGAVLAAPVITIAGTNGKGSTSAMLESILLAGLYASPILYELERVPESFRWLIELNPMTGVVVLTRAAVMGRPMDGSAIVASVAITAVVLALGALVFSRRAREFADLV